MMDMVKDLLIHIKNQSKEMDSKEERILQVQQMNKNIKMAYSVLIDEMKEKENKRIEKEEIYI